MTKRVVLYCPDLPPIAGGVSDHTGALARALAARGVDLEVLGRRGDPALLAPIACRTGITPHAVASAASGASGVIVQYVPFLYARLGVAPSLVRAVAALRRARLAVGVLLHEPFVPFTRLPWLVTGWPMRWQFRAIMRRADVIWSPVPAFLELARAAARAGTRLAVTPVGSTVAVAPVARAQARDALALGPADVALGLFSPDASGALPGWIAAAAAAVRDLPQVVWVAFGKGSERAVDSPVGGARVLRLGWLSPERISHVFQALDVSLAPFVDGLTLRRTSAMTALAHGIPLVSSRGHLFDPALAGAAACERTPEEFGATVRALVTDADRRRALGAAALAFYRDHASVDVLAARVAADVAAW